MTDWNEKMDVVVIGSGVAGLSAALEACDAGASVVVLEKMKVKGGNTRISGGALAAPKNYLQEKKGIKDSPELFSEDMLRAGLGLNHPHLLKVVTETANEAIEWTRDTLGVKYLDRLDRLGGHSVARCLTLKNHSGAVLIKMLSNNLKQRGVEIRTCCLLTRLHQDRQNAVCGVQIRSGYKFPERNSGTVWNIRAKKAVILATGGFGSDIKFRKNQNPRLDESVGSTNQRGATADGLIAALKIGAAPIHLSWIQLGPWSCADEKGYGWASNFASYSVYPSGILIDPATGQRIVNEWADRRTRSDAILNTGHKCVGIVDANGAEKDEKSLEHSLKRGYVKCFSTLTDLSVAFTMPEGELKRTVDRYNQMVNEKGPDPFGKPLADGSKPLVKPPFYAIRLWPKVHYTPGGVGINSNAQVIDYNNSPIPNLYAAGEVCGGIHGANRLGCCALTECIIFGRIAGQQAVTNPD